MEREKFHPNFYVDITDFLEVKLEALRCLTHQAVAQLELRRKVADLDEVRRALAEERNKAEDLLRNLLPESIAEELKTRSAALTPKLPRRWPD